MPRGGRGRGGPKRKTEGPAVASALKVQRAMAQHRVDTKIDLNAADAGGSHAHNMRWAQARAQAVADEIAEVERETGKTADPALYKLMLGLRGMAQQCAEGAAPYLHPRLAAVANLDPPNEDGPKTPEELLA